MTSLLLQQALGQCVRLRRRTVFMLSRAGSFYNPGPKPMNKEEIKENVEGVIKDFPTETRKLFTELQRRFSNKDGIVELREHGDYKVPFTFGSEEDIARWVVTADSDLSGGKSYATFQLGQNKTGLFRGFLDADIPDGNFKKTTGYANIQSRPQRKSFFRVQTDNWQGFDHLVVRCRGDGRRYMLNIHCDKYFDLMWNDIYSYPLYTRGGPYWQVEKIPFSKLLLSAAGRIQDSQEDGIQRDMDNIMKVGITVGDNLTGPFQLEIDYIAVQKDFNHKEEFAYEKYTVPKGYLF